MFEINGERWRIVFVSPNHPQLIRSDGSTTIGACNDDTKTIYLNENLNDYMIKKVLTHEITHAAMFSYNVMLCPRQEELLASLLDTYGHEIVNLTNQFFNRLTYK